MASSKNVYVLYVDHQSHPAPLSSCYHATGTRRLSSSVERYPPSTLTEIDSAYCPQCLGSHDADSAARLGFCPKASCQWCPICQSALTVDIQDKLCFYKCGLCTWDSRECQLTQPASPQDDGSLSRVELARALEDLGFALKSRRDEGRDASQNHFKALSAAWVKRSKNMTGTLGQRKKGIQPDGPEGWSVEALEASLGEKKQDSLSDNNIASLLDMSVDRVAIDDSDEEPAHAGIQELPQLALEMQILNSGMNQHQNGAISRNNLLPLPMPFRARLNRRCRAELEEGRPGILLKPKLNPLEGDTSLRSGHGQWWKKDSSAIHVMPRIGVLKHQIIDGHRVFLLKVTNPTLGPVRLRFASSLYSGEREWGTNNSNNAAASTTTTPLMSDLLVDELFQVHLNLELNTKILENMKRTESVELLSAEDSFIELGGKSDQIPDQVKNWEPKQQKQKQLPPGTSYEQESTMRLVASSTSTAFFELTLANAAGTATREGYAVAVPLALELEAGNGSWESSLVPKSTGENELDWVSFDLVITWT